MSEPLVRKLYRWTRPCFSSSTPDGTPVPIFRSCLQHHPLNGPMIALIIAPFTNALTRNPEPFRLVFVVPKAQGIQGKQARHPCLIRRSEWSIWNPVREFGGTKNHPAPNDPKLGRLRCARQGLVRVPESNTKYGANWGKPEGAEPSDLAQVSVSPERFPRENICFGAADLEFAPLITGQLYFVLQGAFGGCSGKTHVRLR